MAQFVKVDVLQGCLGCWCCCGAIEVAVERGRGAMEGSIAQMLALRATRSMWGGGGVSESREVVADVVESAGAADDSIIVIVIVSGLWSI